MTAARLTEDCTTLQGQSHQGGPVADPGFPVVGWGWC